MVIVLWMFAVKMDGDGGNKGDIYYNYPSMVRSKQIYVNQHLLDAARTKCY